MKSCQKIYQTSPTTGRNEFTVHPDDSNGEVRETPLVTAPQAGAPAGRL